MAIIIHKKDIETITNTLDVVKAIENGFIAYSIGLTVVPPVAELLFEKPKGETHIKYGYIKEQDYAIVKIASGFYENTQLGISSSQGLMILLSQKTGETKGILLDEGYLTNIRTAAAGALAVKYFAPKSIKGIGIIGSGIQARLQLRYLQKYTSCKQVWIWNKNIEGAQKFKEELGNDFNIQIAKNTSELAQSCNLIVTTTPSENALLKAEDIQQGTHITAVGSDTPEKQELDSTILQKADIVVADSISQCKSRGEIYHALKNKTISSENILELGTAIQNPSLHRTNENQISVVDLTGVAVQDIMIATAVYDTYKNNKLKNNF
ncbi:Ornithine cyclodeaminase [Tenacibaculum sp. 190130A14a]|uniref:NAD(P)-binding domain-containing protein n=1 Tax=Tenacibaculum polynesiense TaxID=3137857 RepID=A0ABM9PC58_9FLAO